MHTHTHTGDFHLKMIHTDEVSPPNINSAINHKEIYSSELDPFQNIY